jgi:histidinol-phosphate aminotransferase
MQHLVRECFKSGGYVFARKADDIARAHGVERVARLASNENPRPPSEKAIENGYRALRSSNRYPDECSASLVASLTRQHGNYHFVTGVGMDGVIETVIRTLVEPGEKVAVSTPTFSFYALAAKAQGARVDEISRKPDFYPDLAEFGSRASDAKISFLCTPNNPTGSETTPEEIEEILSEISGVLFLDNAYVEFSDYDYRPLMKKFDNLVLGRTMSKAYSLAGLRVGYAFVPEWLVSHYMRAATPFTLNSVSSAAAAGALMDSDHVKETVIQVRKWREQYRNECKYPVFPSGANFVMVDVAPRTGDEMVELLACRGVIVRSCSSFRGLPDHYIRVSVGEDWENERFLEEINRI